MLLLYIVWDDWTIFMISRSNGQLEEQLEYTLLKHDCHSWWISKMQSGREETLEERYAIIFCFKIGKKNATETYGMLHFFWSMLQESSISSWVALVMRDDEGCGKSKEVRTPQLIGQRNRVRVRVTMLRFYGSSARDSFGRGQHSSNRVSGISSWTIHQSSASSLS